MAEKHSLEARADLMQRMADTVDVDLGDAVASGRISGADLRAATLRCYYCTAAETCSAWMSAGAPGAEDGAPRYCENRLLFDRLPHGYAALGI